MEERAAERPLARVLGVSDLVFLVLGVVIGSGIFLVPSVVLRNTGGRAGPALALWLCGGALSVMGALTYGELAASMPASGGLYAYIRNAFGGFLAFLYGWALLGIIGSGSLAALSVAFANYLGEFLSLGTLGTRLAAVGLICLIGLINVSGTRRSVGVQNWVTLLKVGAILLMAILLIGRGAALREAFSPSSRGTPSLTAGVGGLIAILWAYEGWQFVTFSAGEVVEPQRTFPRGIILGTSALVVIYLLANVAYLAALGQGAAQSERVAVDAVRAVLGSRAAKAMTAVSLAAIFSAANGTLLTTSRVYFAMARDGLFFEQFGKVDARFGTPAWAIGATTVWAAVLAASGSFEQLLTYVVFTSWIFYGLGALSLFWDRRRRPAGPRPFVVPLYPWIPALFVLSAAGIVGMAIVSRPVDALVGLGLVLLGAPAYLLQRRRKRRGFAESEHPLSAATD